MMESPDPLKVEEVQNLRRRLKVKVILQKKHKQGLVEGLVEMSTPPTPSTTPPCTTPTKARLVRPGNFGTNYQRTPGDSWPTKNWATWRLTNSSSCTSKL